MKLLDTQTGPTWRIYHIESHHSDYYMTEQAVYQPNGIPIWILADLKCFIKPEFLAQATKITGEAIAKAQKDIREAATSVPCDECLGKKSPDGPPCWKCNGKDTA